MLILRPSASSRCTASASPAASSRSRAACSGQSGSLPRVATPGARRLARRRMARDRELAPRPVLHAHPRRRIQLEAERGLDPPRRGRRPAPQGRRLAACRCAASSPAACARRRPRGRRPGHRRRGPALPRGSRRGARARGSRRRSAPRRVLELGSTTGVRDECAATAGRTCSRRCSPTCATPAAGCAPSRASRRSPC